MDVSRFKTGDWLLVGGGAVMLVVAQILDWATVDSERGSGGLHNAFDYPATGGLAWALTVAAGILAFLLASGLMRPGRAPWPELLLGATGVATVLMVVRVILGAGEIVTFDLQRGPGMWAALLAAVLGFAGAVTNYRTRATASEAPPPSARLPQSG